MNEPAHKEPSMDEILSSIRQIIADDDAGSGAGERSTPRAIPAHKSGAVRIPDAGTEEPLALSVAQILAEEKPVARVSDLAAYLDDDKAAPMPEDEASDPATVYLDPDDIAFETDDVEAEPGADAEHRFPDPVLPAEADAPAPYGAADADIGALPAPDEAAKPAHKPIFSVPPRPAPARAQASVASAAPMPDPSLSSAIAEQLLDPATKAAVKGTFSKLGNLGLGNQDLTIETMTRELLRPLLKEWLDEHLPSVVERMVEKEIARISRGAE